LRRAKLHLGKGPFLGIEDIEKAISMDEKYKGYLMRASYYSFLNEKNKAKEDYLLYFH
jgi:Tfp pilus assembly protein PilF